MHDTLFKHSISSAVYFSSFQSYTSLDKFIPMCYIALVATWIGIFSFSFPLSFLINFFWFLRKLNFLPAYLNKLALKVYLPVLESLTCHLRSNLNKDSRKRHAAVLAEWMNKAQKLTLAGDITDKLPTFYDIWIFTLEQNYTLVGSLLKFLLSIKSLFGFLYLNKEK